MDNYTKRTALKMTLLSQLLLDELDDLKTTTIYKQSFRNLVSKLEKELEKTCKLNFETIYKEDAGTEINMLNEVVDSIIHKSLNTDIEFKTPHYLYCDKKTGKRILSTLEPKEFFKK